MFYTVFQLCSPKWHLLKQLTCWLVGRSVIRSWHVFGDVCMTWCYLLRNQLQWVAAALSFWNQFLFWWVCCHYDYPERSMLICSMPSKFKRQNKRHITRNVLTFPIYVKKRRKISSWSTIFVLDSTFVWQFAWESSGEFAAIFWKCIFMPCWATVSPFVVLVMLF